MRRVLILVAVSLALGFTFWVKAQEPVVRWEDACVSHNGADQGLDNYVGAALREWGAESAVEDCGAGSDIFIDYVPSLQEPAIAQAAYSWDQFFHLVACRIDVSAIATNGVPQETLYEIVAHETGHCLGLGHTNDPASIMYPFCCSWWNELDRANIAALYPLVDSTPEPTGTEPIPTATSVPPVSPTPSGREPGEPFYAEWTFPDHIIPADYGFAAVYQQQVDGDWLRWTSGTPRYVNTLDVLRRGDSYWFVPWK